MSNTINGLTLKELFQALSAPFEPGQLKRRDMDDCVYLPYKEVRKRLNECTGFRYDETYTPVKVETITGPDGACRNIYTTQCTITLLSDEGTKIISRTCNGSSVASYVYKGDKKKGIEMLNTQAVENDIENACIDAFKRCCKRLGIDSEEKGRKSGGNGNRKGGAGSVSEEKQYYITFKSNFSSLRNGGFRADIYCESGETVLVIFPDSIKTFTSLMSDKTKSLGEANCAGKAISVVGTTLLFNGVKQIRFTGFPNRG